MGAPFLEVFKAKLDSWIVFVVPCLVEGVLTHDREVGT